MGETAVMFRVSVEFSVTRRIDWEHDLKALRRHLDEVQAQVDKSPLLQNPTIRGDLMTAVLRLEAELEAADSTEAEMLARDAFATALREAGARHIGLLPLADECRVKPKVNAWAGLKIPQWYQKGVELAVAS